jgi:hypothetical protein
MVQPSEVILLLMLYPYLKVVRQSSRENSVLLLTLSFKMWQPVRLRPGYRSSMPETAAGRSSYSYYLINATLTVTDLTPCCCSQHGIYIVLRYC